MRISICGLAFALVSAGTMTQAQEKDLAFVDVSVASMERPEALEHQTVIVRNGRIATVGPLQSVRLPDSAERIDGRGKFLMPGLADMHVHFIREALTPDVERPMPTAGRQPGIPASASTDYDLENRAYALMVLANGVTTVRNMWGSNAIRDLADSINSDRVSGPHIYSTRPITDGNPPLWRSTRIVETEEDAENAVRADERDGYIAVKVYSSLSKRGYDAIIAAARRVRLPVVGHVATSVGLDGAIAARQDSIEHLDSFLRVLAPESRTLADALQHADLTRLMPMVRAIKDADMWVCPTTGVGDRPRTDSVWLEQASFVPQDVFRRYRRMYPNADADPRSTLEARAIYVGIVRALHAGGVHLLLGTDTFKLGTLPGYSLHAELETFVSAGLSPYEAIRAGTVEAAKFLHQENEFGAVREGLRADLLLVDGNPLADVKNASRISGVVAAGRWLTTQAITGRLTDLRTGYRQ
jgi:imidazolonepropionase-like amidohydrolase